jgi:DNA-binding Lrp family transcriptional regulator/transposase
MEEKREKEASIKLKQIKEKLLYYSNEMNRTLEEYLGELRKMSYKELAEFFDISLATSYRLKRSIQPNVYEVLTDPYLSIEEMAEKLGITKQSAAMYRRLLRKILNEVGISLQPYPKYKYQVKYKYKKIYIRIPIDLLDKPRSIEDLQNNIGLSRETIVNELRKLEEEGKVKSFRLYIGSKRGGQKHRSYKLFGKLTNKTYFYNPDYEENAANFILENIFPEGSREISKGKMYALRYHLRSCLPESLFEKVILELKFKSKNLN